MATITSKKSRVGQGLVVAYAMGSRVGGKEGRGGEGKGRKERGRERKGGEDKISEKKSERSRYYFLTGQTLMVNSITE